MAAARSERYLDSGRAGEEPSRCTISGLSRVVHAAGHQLAAMRPRDAPTIGRARRVPPHVTKLDRGLCPAGRIGHPAREVVACFGANHPVAATLKKPVTLSVVGTGTTKFSLSATIMQSAVAGNIGRKNGLDLAFHEKQPRTKYAPAGCRQNYPGATIAVTAKHKKAPVTM